MAKQTKPEKLPARQAAEVVLLRAGKPMHYREITRVAIEEGLIRAKKGKRKVDPDATLKTVRSYLCDQVKGDEPRLVRVDEGVFDLTAATRRALKRAEGKSAPVA